ncbi:hypothetical protein EBZ80_13150 [bacterium]|nr:hypothetical protein [bacterium]
MKNPVLTAIKTAMLTCLLASVSAPAATSGDAPTERALSVKISAESISKLLNMSIEDSRTIADWVSGTFIRGTTLTKANATLRVRPHDDNAAIDLVIESETTADTVGYNRPTPSIGVDVSFSSFSRATTTKTIFLDANNGILVTPATTTAWTEMTIHNVNVWAGGLFKRLKRRLAYNAAWRKLMQEKANQEYQISMRVAGELNAMADAKTKEILHPVNVAFKKYFIRGFLQKNRLPGNILAKTSEKGASLTAWAPQDAVGTPDPRLTDPSRGPMSVHLNGVVINHILQSLLGGVDFTSGEIAEIVAFMNGISEPVPRNRLFRIHLRENNPVEFSFDAGVMTVRVYATKVEVSGGHDEPGTIAQVRFAVTREGDNTIRVKRQGQVEVLPLPPASEPSRMAKRAIDYYFNSGSGMDKQITLGQLPGDLAKLGSLELLGLDLTGGWLMLETKLNPAASTIAANGERGQK